MVIKERARLRESWEEIKKTLVESNAEIEKLELTGPNYVKKLERDLEYARNGISRWTDNLSILRSWVKSRTGLKEKLKTLKKLKSSLCKRPKHFQTTKIQNLQNEQTSRDSRS
eukprot:GHVP01047386.1.p1 GENE.GHVP01047386.1~~GHVP01047386.1.p1  ORF type:complete len:113 (-),score=15.83 GHVP01047386.1:958-1296(-)